jgi:hypothetical protein
MSNTYLVNWSDKGIDDAEEIVSGTARGAYLIFVEENIFRSVSVMVWAEGEGAETDEFDEHLSMDKEPSSRNEVLDKQKESSHRMLDESLVSGEKIKVSSYAIESKLDELIGLIRHIRLMFYVFCLVTVVVPYFVAQLNN